MVHSFCKYMPPSETCQVNKYLEVIRHADAVLFTEFLLGWCGLGKKIIFGDLCGMALASDKGKHLPLCLSDAHTQGNVKIPENNSVSTKQQITIIGYCCSNGIILKGGTFSPSFLRGRYFLWPHKNCAMF